MGLDRCDLWGAGWRGPGDSRGERQEGDLRGRYLRRARTNCLLRCPPARFPAGILFIRIEGRWFHLTGFWSLTERRIRRGCYGCGRGASLSGWPGILRAPAMGALASVAVRPDLFSVPAPEDRRGSERLSSGRRPDALVPWRWN